MAARRQTQVMAELVRTAGRALGKVASSYQSSVVRPIRGRVRKAKSAKGLLQALGAGLVREMDEGPLAEAMTEASAAATGVGMLSALPRGMVKAESGRLRTDD